MQLTFCESSPCLNGGECSNIAYGYSCECPVNFRGHQCEIHICQSQTQCLNGASCIFTGGCVCAPAYTGEHCETHLCDVTQCQNGGMCSHYDGMCQCLPGFTGNYLILYWTTLYDMY